MDAEVLVVGAGIVGVSVAVHLVQRGRKVMLLDRRGPGEETSHGNAGLIERASVVPYGFPRDLATLLRYAGNGQTALRYDWRALPTFLPWLARYWRESAPARLARASRDMLPLIAHSVIEHDRLIERAGLSALVKPGGWMEAFRTEAAFQGRLAVCERLAAAHGLAMRALDRDGLQRAEAGLGPGFIGAIHWMDPKSVVDPGQLTRGYARLFQSLGGTLATGEATQIAHRGGTWRVHTAGGELAARELVIAQGPWSMELIGPLGYRIPLKAKRGYHMHYAVASGATQSVPIADCEIGYVVAPMQRGLRLTTGVEIARPGSAPSPIQLARAEGWARDVFRLGRRLDDAAWMGARPCTPDMRPVIGPAGRHPGLWFAFGHNHHGLTLGPASGRLLAEMMTGTGPYVDPRPYSPARFG
ncbi:amino acid dehydrogenase [Cupriavidus sp. USMAHM13]|uniref:NAD(P)/FAD-dependent oxidoreductase n=1 Tax=Cupriavidus sp. USMAHM13 TaxID=1389192 RepID=UPI0008A671F5|nr:FAD-binding oxidoreductase [Cupriavidus sp. USMAHM13]AOZ01755.1 amino acid dehydrogenase [Cupriavidus sp. USMAHM13]